MSNEKLIDEIRACKTWCAPAVNVVIDKVIAALEAADKQGEAVAPSVAPLIARLDDLYYRLDKPIRMGENPQYDYATFQNEVYLNWREISKATRPQPIDRKEIEDEVTPKMCAAGIAKYEEMMDGDRLPDGNGYDEEVVTAIFKAMLSTKGSK